LHRLERDTEEWGRTVPLVIGQCFNRVRPIHLEFVEPNKRYADMIVPEGGLNEMGVYVIVQKIRSALGRDAHRV